MGNTIRLGIATVGLAFNRWITARRMKQTRPVLLVLGRQEAGKSTVVFRIKNPKVELPTTNYVKTNGFSVQDLKEKDTHIKLYDIGGSEVMRELWSHYYGDVHGFIYVIDSTSSSEEIQESARILEQVLKDERVQGKPILILANKQDFDSALTEMEVTNQMDLIRLVNTAKCLTRLDVCTASQPSRPDSGITVGFKWIVSHIKWRWVELNERVEHDALIEQRTENAKFEMMKEQIHAQNSISTVINMEDEVLEAEPKRKPSLEKLDPTSLQQRSDPDGGNDVITPVDDFVQNNLDLVNNSKDVQRILIRAQAQVHEVSSTPTPTPAASDSEPPAEILPPLNPPKRKLSEGASPKKIKHFRNKTAPMEIRLKPNLIL